MRQATSPHSYPADYTNLRKGQLAALAWVQFWLNYISHTAWGSWIIIKKKIDLLCYPSETHKEEGCRSGMPGEERQNLLFDSCMSKKKWNVGYDKNPCMLDYFSLSERKFAPLFLSYIHVVYFYFYLNLMLSVCFFKGVSKLKRTGLDKLVNTLILWVRWSEALLFI